jgi:hypothetical protein
MAVQRLKNLGQNELRLGQGRSLRSEAMSRLETLKSNGIHRIKSDEFDTSMKDNTLEQLFNKLMLFFWEMKRCETCPIFGKVYKDIVT